MISRQNNTLLVNGEITFENVRLLLDESAPFLSNGCDTVDFSGVVSTDSSAVSLAFEWQRRVGSPLRFIGLPESMLSLLQLYGVSDLFH